MKEFDMETKFDIDYGMDPKEIKDGKVLVESGESNKTPEEDITLRDIVRTHFADKYEKTPNDVLLSKIEVQEQKLARSERRQKLNKAIEKATELDREGYNKNVKPISQRLNVDNKLAKGVIGGLATGVGIGFAVGVGEPEIANVVQGVSAGLIGGSMVGLAGGMLSSLNDQTRVLSSAKNKVVSYIRDKYTAFQEEKLNGMYEALEYKIDFAKYHDLDYKDAFPNPERVEESLEEVVDSQDGAEK